MTHDIVCRIEELKKKRNAVILVHNYQRGEVQDIADYNGDSLGLSRLASRTDADVIVFCGVKFMAETAAILCPGKTVLMPDINAGCPMADMITRQELAALKKKHPGAVTVGYVNTTAEVKAELDICCTSANAVKVVASLPLDNEIIFVPDKYLGSYVARETGRNLILWKGYCPSHARIQPEHVTAARQQFPGARVIVHPECPPAVVALADAALSTGGMLTYVAESVCREFVVGTEIGMLYRLAHDNPQKKFYSVTDLAVCPNMKLTSLEKVLWSLEEMKYEIRVADEVREKALHAVNRMLAIV